MLSSREPAGSGSKTLFDKIGAREGGLGRNTFFSGKSNAFRNVQFQGAEYHFGQKFVFRYGADVGRGAQVGNLNEFAVRRNEYFRPGHGEPVHQGEYIVHVSLGELDGIGFGGGDDVVAYVLDGFINVVVVLRVASIACVGFFGEIGASGAYGARNMILAGLPY